MSWSFRVCCNLLVTCLHIVFSPAPCSLWSSYKDVALLLLELVVWTQELGNISHGWSWWYSIDWLFTRSRFCISRSVTRQCSNYCSYGGYDALMCTVRLCACAYVVMYCEAPSCELHLLIKYDNVCTDDMWNALVCNMLIPDVPSCASYALHGCLVWVTPEHHQFRWLWLVFNKINCTSTLHLGSCPGTSLHAWMPGSRTRTAVHAK